MAGRSTDSSFRERRRRRTRRRLITLALTLLAGCRDPDAPIAHSLEPTRGYILISLGSLAAGHLGAYGHERDTSPAFDRLAARGVLFERAIAQSPATLVSNLSLLTGLYPRQHGVSSPATILASEIPTLAERFANFGFFTAGFTEGGLVSRHFGFHRGFDEFDDSRALADSGIETTFEKGLASLQRLEPTQRFFLFLHTSSLEAPYDPPPGFASRFWSEASPPGPAPTPETIRAVNSGFLEVDDLTGRYFEALYDAGVSYVDGVLDSFFRELEALDLLGQTTIVITSDHGVEFLGHGGLGHSQVYAETVHVPLLVLHPELAAARRVADLVESVDIAPTLASLARLPPARGASGDSLVPHLLGRSHETSWAYAEAEGVAVQRSLLRRERGEIHQLVTTAIRAEPDGTWLPNRTGFEVDRPQLQFSLVSFHRPRTVRLLLEGAELQRFAVGTEWTQRLLELPAGRRRYRLDLLTDGCESPRRLGLGDDPRCLAIKVRGLDVSLSELFRLDLDPRGSVDVASEEIDELEVLRGHLDGLGWVQVASARWRPVSEDARDALRALGYID